MCDTVVTLPIRLDEEDEMDESGKGARNNPFRRDFRKSMFRDGPVFAQWMERVHEYGIQVSEGEGGSVAERERAVHLSSDLCTQEGGDSNEVPEFEGDASQSQRTPSPTPSGQEEGDESKDNGELLLGDAVHVLMGKHVWQIINPFHLKAYMYM